MSEETEFDLVDPTESEFDPDPARRRWAYHPRRRRMTALQRRYFGKGHRGRRSRRLRDPARRRRRGGRRMRAWIMDPRRRRRHDPAFGTPGSAADIGSDYLAVAAGSMLHNFITTSKGYLGKTLNLGPINLTQLGGVALGLGFIGEKMGFIRQNGVISDLLKGIFAEGFNAPSLEGVTRVGAASSTPGMGGGAAAGYGPGSGIQPQGTGYSSNVAVSAGPISQPGGPYATPVWWWT